MPLKAHFLPWVKQLSLVLLTFSLVFFPQWFLPLSYVTAWFREATGWNWLWPWLLLAGSFSGERFSRRPRPAQLSVVKHPFVLVLVFLLYVLGTGWRDWKWANLGWMTMGYQFAASFSEEWFFRGWALATLSAAEAKFYRDDRLRVFSPLSVLAVSLLFGAMHGLNPVLKGGAFDWAWFASTFESSVLFSFYFLLSGSLAAAGLVHFLANLDWLLK